MKEWCKKVETVKRHNETGVKDAEFQNLKALRFG